MKYATTTMRPDLILEFDENEFMGLKADGIIANEYETNEDGDAPQEYVDQEKRLKEEREAAEAEARGESSDITILREDGSEVGGPDKAAQDAAEARDAEQTPEPSPDEDAHKSENPGGKRVSKPKTPAKDAE